METIQVRVGEEVRSAYAGVTVAEVLGCDVGCANGDVVAATLNNHLVALDTHVDGDAVLAPVTRTDPAGQGVLRRSIAHILLTAVARRPDLQLAVGQSLLGGHFYEVRSSAEDPDLAALAAELTAAMEEYVAADLPFERIKVPVEGATRMLSDPGGSKGDLLRSWPQPTVGMIRLDGFVDVQHGPYPPTTGFSRGARLIPYPPGLILQFPAAGRPERVEPGDGRKLWTCYSETRDWNRKVGIATVGDLNSSVLEDRFDQVLQVAEAFHEKKIVHMADAIAARQGAVRVVCVAGPSSAGKTTFVRRLSVQLRVNGIEPVIVGLDDYYKDRDNCPVDEHGELDFEALEAIDVPQIHAHLAELLAGNEVRIPSFDFVHQRPTDPSTWRALQLRPDQVLLLEGIHGLNPHLTEVIPGEARFRIYINALTQLVIDEHNRIFTSDGRLLRRIVRDRRYRGTPASETIERWPSVRRGEEKHIYPYQEECEGVFNSALVYEAPVLKTFAQRYLLEVPQDHPSRVEAYRLLKFLELFVPVFPDMVPANSVLREFIGGSGFSYR